ncbi:MAG TPA: hypothetical protein ENO03_06030 [Candidatus Aminicenantes bacterium]|nr:hypothetical protein [Candidatus Aminicenantes bacterium]
MERIIESAGDGSPNKPPKVSQLILHRADQLMAKALGLKASAAGLAELMLGPTPEKPPAEKRANPASFLSEILGRLEEIGDILADAQGHIDQLRSQF